MSNLAVFQFNTNQVRVIEIDGDPWFVVSDLLSAMETKTRVSDAKSRLEEDLGEGVVINYPLETNGGVQSVVLTNESGITFLLTRSRTPLGKKLNKWIHVDILPSIRRHGVYSITEKLQPLEKVETSHKVIDSIFANVPIKPELVAGIKLNIAQKQLPELASDLEESRQLLINNTAQKFELLTPTEIGKRIGLSGQAVNKKLCEMGFQVKNDDRKSKKEPSYLPIGCGKEFSDLTLATGKDGDVTSYQQLRWYSSLLQQF